MEITKEELLSEKANAQARKEQLLAEINAVIGESRVIERMLAALEKPELENPST